MTLDRTAPSLDVALEDAAVAGTVVALAGPAFVEFLCLLSVHAKLPMRAPLLLNRTWLLVPIILIGVAICLPLRWKGIAVAAVSLYLGTFAINNSMGLLPWNGTFSAWVWGRDVYTVPMLVAALASIGVGFWRWGKPPISLKAVDAALAFLALTAVACTYGALTFEQTHREVPNRHLVLIAALILLGAARVRRAMVR